jgi:parallel beta-helix repeat protein
MGKYDGSDEMNTSVKNCRITGFRNGIRTNHNTGITIEGNEVSNNRYGIFLGSGSTGSIKGNDLKDNEVFGLFIWGAAPAAAIFADKPTIEGNTFSGNWAGDVGIEWIGIDYTVNLNDNTFFKGTKTVQVLAIDDNRLDFTLGVRSSQTFTRTAPGFQANIVTKKASDVTLTDYVLYIDSKYYSSLLPSITRATGLKTIKLNAGRWTDTEIIIPQNVTLQGAGNTTVLTGYIELNAGSVLKDAKIECSTEATPRYRTALLVSGANTTVDHVEFLFTKDTSKEAILVTGNNFTIKNSIFDGFRKGLYIHPDISVEIVGNTFEEVNPFSTDGYCSPFVVKGNTFNRGVADRTWRSPHIIDKTIMEKESLYNPVSWNTNLKATINQMLNSNTWTYTTAVGYNENEPLKAIRIQNTNFTNTVEKPNDIYISDEIK